MRRCRVCKHLAPPNLFKGRVCLGCWVERMNKEGKDIIVELKNFSLKWGVWYETL